MTTTSTPREVFVELLARMKSGRFSEAMELYAEDFSLWLPFWLPEPMMLGGKQQHTSELAPKMTDEAGKPPRTYENLEVRDLTIHETTQPGVIVAEWTYVSTIGESQVVNPNIVVMEIRDGKILWTRDYHNHVARAQADGEIPAYLKILEDMILPQDRG